MFTDLAMLVEQQGEMVTRIEDHIMSEQIILTTVISLAHYIVFQLPVLMWKRDEKIFQKQKPGRRLQGKRR